MGVAASAVRREELGDVARLAHKLDRHTDMFVLVNMLAKTDDIQMNVDENHLLFIAYRSTFSDKHGKLRRIRVILEREDDPKRVQCLVFYLGWLEDDMQAACRVALDVLDNHLLPSCSNVAENAALLVLYNKMKGDAYWFMHMLDKEEDKEHLAHMVLGAYEAASEAAEGLSPAHPLRLALRLNMTVLYHDIMKWNEHAISLAKLALDEAGPELALLDEESYKESAETLKLMDENLKQWTSDDPKIIKGPFVDENTLASPPPVVPRSKGGPPLDKFTSPGDYQVHDGPSPTTEIRSRKKAAKMMRGHKDSVLLEGLVFVASTAKKICDTSVMLETVNMVGELDLELTPEERDILSTAYKYVFSKMYKDLRAISGREEDHVKAYRAVLEDEMERTCWNVLNIVQRHLLPFCCGPQEDVVLYTKMVGDIYWFLAMLSKVLLLDKESLAESTLAAYESASKAAQSLSPAHPLRLAVYLTMSSFYKDVNRPDSAYNVGKQALEEASQRELDLLREASSESHRQSTCIIELIKENLKKWRPITKEASSSLNEVKEAPSSATTPPSVSVVCLDFTSLADWGYDVHEGISKREKRSRMKAAQARRCWMG